jgi:hypothetical protein
MIMTSSSVDGTSGAVDGDDDDGDDEDDDDDDGEGTTRVGC